MGFPTDENLIVGLDRADDAGVYRITDEIAMIQTVDFFTPVVDDPFWFGQIAAANALSDVYAMGGTPKTAMNIVCFPLGRMDLSVLRRILEGGIVKMREAGVVLVGGHSIEDKELKYGLSVTGFIHPDRVLTKKSLAAGDRLVLTKPLGIGIVTTAMKAGMAAVGLAERAVRIMAALNRRAAEIMSGFPVHACTDITGFGLLGHLAEMVTGSGLGAHIQAARVPVIPEALEFAGMGLIPAGAHRNRDFRADMVDMAADVGRIMPYVLFDPQTSGGLLISVAAEKADALAAELKRNGHDDAAVIGEVVREPVERIRVTRA